MRKKRYTVRLSRPLAQRFELVTERRRGGKSGLVEEALKALLEPQALPGIDDALGRRLDELNRGLARIGRDIAITTETLALYVRYFLTITPPLPQSEQEPARLLGRERFDVFVAEVGRRLAGDRRLVSEVMESIAKHEPDLFAAATGQAPRATDPAPDQDAVAVGERHG